MTHSFIEIFLTIWYMVLGLYKCERNVFGWKSFNFLKTIFNQGYDGDMLLPKNSVSEKRTKAGNDPTVIPRPESQGQGIISDSDFSFLEKGFKKLKAYFYT